MQEADLPLLVDAAREAGQIALGFSGPNVRRWEKADGAGPVTEADLAVNASLEKTLMGARADYGWLSEETEDDVARLGHEHVFIIDPIDGTRSFVEGGRTWAISIAVARHGEIVAGVIYLPMRNMLYAAALNEGATLNGAPLAVSRRGGLDDARVLGARPNFDAAHWIGGAPPVERHYRPSLAYRLALVAEGRFDAMLTLRKSWEWDLAAGCLLITEAGGTVTDRSGSGLRFNNAEPLLDGIVAGPPDIQRELRDRLRPV